MTAPFRLVVVTDDDALVGAIAAHTSMPTEAIRVVPTVDAALAVPLSEADFVVLDQRASGGQLDEALERVQETSFLGASMFDALSDGVLTVDTDGIIRRFNPSAEEIYGRLAIDVVGRHVSVLAHAEVRALQAELLARVLAGETLKPVSSQRVRGDGSVIDVELTAAPIRAGHGAVVGCCLMIRDVTERRRAAAEAELFDAQFRRAFSDSQVPMAILDTDFRYLQVNDALLASAGLTRDQVVGQIWRAGSSGAGDDQVRARVLASGQIYRQVSEYVSPDGATGWVESLLSPIEVAGATVEYLVQMRDVTAERQGEEQLRYFATHDPLTGVLNRRAFIEQLRAHLGAEHRAGSARGSLLMVDLDNFKVHNDSYGHASGDTLLVGIAETMRDAIRETDLLGRLGGDEFVILLPSATAVEAEFVATRLLDGIRGYGEMTAPAQGIPVTASIGVVDLPDNVPAEQVLHAVDRAVYAAKALGRDCWAR